MALIKGSKSSDRLFGTSGADQMYGYESNDVFYSSAGSDEFYGGDGIDAVTYTNSSRGVTVNLDRNKGAGGNAAGDTYYSIENVDGSRYADFIIGNDGDNVIDGLHGNDILHGNGGADRLYGGSGHDELYGGTGADKLYGGFGNDILDGGAGADQLYGGYGYDTVSYEASATGVSVDFLYGPGRWGDAEGDTYDRIENIAGSDHGDTLSGDNGANVIEGNGATDFITDRGGDDTLYGGDGNDWFNAGAGADDYYGGADNDLVNFAESATGVTVNLATGVGSGGIAEGDTYTGIETLIGSNHGDVLIGDDGNNTLLGSDGADILIGGLGDDHILGDNGGDGSAYADTFVFGDTRGTEADSIYGFAAGVDKIDLTATEFTGFNDLASPGDRYWEQVGDDTVIHYYDHTITLLNVDRGDLGADDFLFA